jgi:recombination protein RecR
LSLKHLPSENLDPVSRLIFELSKLPGIGEKTATRLAYYILKQDTAFSTDLSEALLNAKKKVVLCQFCCNLTEANPCKVCSDTSRDSSIICVVERPNDLHSVEMSGKYKGQYHVLHGALSPLDGIGPDEIRVRELIQRIQKTTHPIEEIVLAMNPSVEGEATALYLSRLLKPMGLRLSQLAYGIPMGGQIEYTDRQTIGKAMENRMEIR